MTKDEEINEGGRPALYVNGNYIFNENEVNLIIKQDFKTEKDLCNYIENNIELFCIDVLNDIYISHSREFSINKKMRYNDNKKIDFFIKCANKTYAIEVKNPTYKSELYAGIGQLLTYTVLFEINQIKVDRYILLTTKYDEIASKTIKKYNLPIDLYIFCKSTYLKLENGCSQR
jgi:hypothetical protein